jgi:RPA family protein
MSESPGTAGTREVAFRVFAAEFDDATVSYSQSDEERAPNYVLTPLGARVNRLFAVGVLTEVERVNEETRRGRVVDPTGAFVTYAGQYQPDEQAFLERAEPPAFVALTGKARTFEPEDSDRVFTSVRPESLNAVDSDTRDRWVVRAAETTLSRLAVFAAALQSDLRGEELRSALEAGGAAEALAEGIPRAIDHYGTSAAYLEATRRMAVDALELVAGERDDVRAPEIEPGEDAPAEIGPLPETDVTIAKPSSVGDSAIGDSPTGDSPTDGEKPASTGDGSVESSGGDATIRSADTDGDTDAQTDTDVDADAVGSSDVDEPGAADEPEHDSASDSGVEAPSGSSTSIEEPEPRGELGDVDDDSSEDVGDGAAGGDASADGQTGGLGDFADPSETGDSGSTTDSDSTTGSGSTDPSNESADSMDPSPAGGSSNTDEMYEMDEEERSEVLEEYGTDFSTGTEVDDPGEADIDVPDADELADEDVRNPGADGTGPTDDIDVDASPSEGDESAASETPETDTRAQADDEPGGDTEPESEAGSEGEAESEGGEDVNLTEAAIDAMDDLDEGDGADRDAVIAAVVDRVGGDPDAVEEAIDDALMSGKCYEPTEDRLKAI